MREEEVNIHTRLRSVKFFVVSFCVGEECEFSTMSVFILLRFSCGLLVSL